MEGMFDHDRGLYAEPNFSFEDTFCREITSCLYEDEYREENTSPGRDAGSRRGDAGLFNPRFDSSGADGDRLSGSDLSKGLTETGFVQEVSENFTDGYGYSVGSCEGGTTGSESPTGTWSGDEELNTGVPSPCVKAEPMKRIRRLRANDRERRRMKSLNRALDSLKKCIPVPQSKRRVTKLEILRIACNYIKSLSDTLRGESSGPSSVFRKRARADAVVNGFSVAQRLEILSGNGSPRI
ncbi:predicted protein [Nematostella vectensis]|uniref:Atonal-related protein 2 n=1 Tax=Nematostella vectensis TaxID=45351 RepID=A7SJ22_NEMVE|nr:neurogenin-1 [Nematostella vectensis]EDO36287.1 predicted protein [Nematostella vectensis]BAJ13487.1 atonal-related protein 2 [Nematostella vectensis]|eukprot:XP_001628350.1 predicted protein [Nematostella vectensis]